MWRPISPGRLVNVHDHSCPGTPEGCTCQPETFYVPHDMSLGDVVRPYREGRPCREEVR